MLVLSRKHGESIRIGESIVIKINHITGGRVSIGIEAPAEIPIVRAELEQQPQPKPIVDMPSVFGGVRVAG